jgi:hypothetical protein
MQGRQVPALGRDLTSFARLPSLAPHPAEETRARAEEKRDRRPSLRSVSARELPNADMRLRPDPEISAAERAAGERSLVLDASFASLAGALSGGVILSAFALGAGAGPLAIGVLAAIPFLSQAAQLPAIPFIERIRQRRTIGVLSLTAARGVIL